MTLARVIFHLPAAVFFSSQNGRLIFIHLQCWEVLPFCRFQRQRCIKILCPKDPDFYTPLALKTAKRRHLPALEVYKNQSPRKGHTTSAIALTPTSVGLYERPLQGAGLSISDNSLLQGSLQRPYQGQGLPPPPTRQTC